ncbi:hypothetical protein B296_00004480 [Ensete ventricosum]|uniref:Uncharacterized protein n=1 Tax=Ensete ventricosum TaxID=4639 RepID=A0A426YUS8_ENSVE|nr:hypothetical protein B296_00004480 [Ensete ventricosum]
MHLLYCDSSPIQSPLHPLSLTKKGFVTTESSSWSRNMASKASVAFATMGNAPLKGKNACSTLKTLKNEATSSNPTRLDSKKKKKKKKKKKRKKTFRHSVRQPRHKSEEQNEE